MIAGDIAAIAILDATLLPAIEVPDAVRAAVNVSGAFDLKARRETPHKNFSAGMRLWPRILPVVSMPAMTHFDF